MDKNSTILPRAIILMKVTSRGRPEQLLTTIQKYIELANNTEAMVWLFSFDEDDKTYNIEFINNLHGIIKQGFKVVTGTSTSKVYAINRDVNEFESPWDILLNISDDQRPIVKGYDDIIRNAMPDDLDASLWFTDGQPRINTQEIVGRNYYNRFKYIYHPAFKSLWCDNLATDIAMFLGRCIKSKQQIVKHHHPAWGGKEAFKMDDLYRRNEAFWAEDEATYKRLIAGGLDKLV